MSAQNSNAADELLTIDKAAVVINIEPKTVERAI